MKLGRKKIQWRESRCLSLSLYVALVTPSRCISDLNIRKIISKLYRPTLIPYCLLGFVEQPFSYCVVKLNFRFGFRRIESLTSIVRCVFFGSGMPIKWCKILKEVKIIVRINVTDVRLI